MTVSIIIVTKTWQKNIEECVKKCQQLNYPDFEIIIVPDENIAVPYANISVIPSGRVSPGEKRDLASKYAKGDILAFIDDDAYPERNWLKNAVSNFKNPEIAAVGGPAVTPPEDGLREKASGKVYESVLLSGNYRYRYVKSFKRFVEDYPSCNLILRASEFRKLGGFNTKFWPGEDTKLCWGIIHKLNKKILYDPQVLVYHHRRKLFLPHLRQIANYALHRGYFVKKYPETSLKFSYFVPSIFISFLLLGLILSFFSTMIMHLFILFILIYIGIVLFFSLNKNIRLTLYVLAGTILSHLTYGIFFVKGLLAKNIDKPR